jgi:glycosyltransferase involved in cell wall biosynthesis
VTPVPGVRTPSPSRAARGPRSRRGDLTARPARDRRPVVVHVGVVGAEPGGMAQVVNEYLSWSYPSLQVRAMSSTRGRGHRWSSVRALGCVVRIVGCRASRRRHAFVVHLSSGGSFVREGGLAALARACGFPVAIQVHGSMFTRFAAARPGLVRTVLRLACAVYVLSTEAEDVVAGLLGPDGGGRVVKVVNGVAVPDGAPVGAKEPVVVFAGEVGGRKGADVLLAAWARVHADHPAWRLVLAGPVEPEIAVLPVPPAATLLGPVGRPEVQRWEERAAVAVLPSRHEALPMFLLEAMARRCAVVATPVGDVGALVGGCGRVVPVDDVEALGAALAELMADPTLSAALGAAARERVVARFSSTALAPVFEREWQALLLRRTAAGAG